MFVMPFHQKVQDAVTPKRDIWSYNKRIENKYHSMLVEVASNVEDVLNAYDENDPMSSVEVMQLLQDYANELYDWAGELVGGMIYQLNDDDEKTWKKHSALMSKQLRYEIEHAPIKPLMQQYLKDNVALIQSMPLNAARRVQKLVEESLVSGKARAESLTSQIMNIGHVTRNRAKLIARTETARMSTGLAKARAQVLSLPWYMWVTSHDARVRSSHSVMHQVLVKWDDPAAPEELDPRSKRSYGHYHPGEIFNCRCFPRPILRLDDISFPAKIYYNNRIERINRNDFIALTGAGIPIAA